MHRLTMHASLSNHSQDVRWSFDLRYNPIGQPTGRGHFPGFVARSRQNPASELRDPAEWARLWHECRDRLARRGRGRRIQPLGRRQPRVRLMVSGPLAPSNPRVYSLPA